MSSADARRLNELLNTALDLPPDERARWLDSLDLRDAALEARLRGLLARAGGIESRAFLQSLPPLGPGEETEADAPGAGERIGPYRLERQIGAGGMGTVWLATRADGLFERSVALKLPLRGMFGADLAERMARERGILAGLEHPNIARLYDAGLSEQGQPYLALEFVDGVAIDEYCRLHAATLRQRLDLFLQVADAVAAAHARLVVHRDLKPANILVTRDGQVRLLDFGVAKLLEQDTPQAGPALTRLSVQALTPDYASPEQIRGETVTIASDIYSLGVVLYELLAGERPYRLRRDSRGALEDAILESEPRPPSAAAGARGLRGDLDTVVLKALRKHPEDRYATVNAFADDVRRYLQGRPVIARPGSGWYRARRFLHRHAFASATAALVAFAILTAAAVALSQAQRADAERRRAEDVNRFIKSIFTSADPFEGGGRSLSAVDLLKQARVRVNREFARRPAQRVELLNTLTVSLANLSDGDTADEISTEALDVARRELPADSIHLREARTARLVVDRLQGRNTDLRHGVDALLAEEYPDPAMRERDRIRLLILSAHAAIDEGRFTLAAAQAKEAFDIAARILDARDPELLEAAVLQGVSLRFAGELDKAEAAARQSLTAALRAADGDGANARVLDARLALGGIHIDMGNAREALQDLEAALAGAPALYGPDSEFETYVESFLARACLDLGDLQAALEHIDRSLELTRKQSDEESRNFAMASAIRAYILLAAGDARGAVEGFESALPFYRRVFGEDHVATLALRINHLVAVAHGGRHAEALAGLQEIAQVHPQIRHWMVVSPAHALGIAQRLAGDAPAALRTQRAVYAALPQVPRLDYLRMAVLDEIGASALAAGEQAQAEEALKESLALHARLEVQETPAHRTARLAVAN